MPRAARPRRTRSGPRTLLLVLGLIAGCTACSEGAVTDWGALHLRESLQASPAVAAAGYGTLLAAVRMLTAALAPEAAVALLGFALVGLGLADVFPLAIARAGAVGGPSGVALASTCSTPAGSGPSPA